jgi:hypothetical protein
VQDARPSDRPRARIETDELRVEVNFLEIVFVDVESRGNMSNTSTLHVPYGRIIGALETLKFETNGKK